MKKTNKLMLFMIMAITSIMLFTACTGKTGSSAPKELTRGTWNENTYTNEYANLEFVIPEDWNSATDEEISALMGITSDTLIESTGNKMSGKMLELKVIYDMMAQNPNTGSNVIVAYENLALSIGGTKYTEEEYMEFTKTQLDGMSEIQGVSYAYGEITEETLCGETYKSLRADIEGMDAYQTYYVRKTDKYMISIIVTFMDDEPITEYFTSK